MLVRLFLAILNLHAALFETSTSDLSLPMEYAQERLMLVLSGNLAISELVISKVLRMPINRYRSLFPHVVAADVNQREVVEAEATCVTSHAYGPLFKERPQLKAVLLLLSRRNHAGRRFSESRETCSNDEKPGVDFRAGSRYTWSRMGSSTLRVPLENPQRKARSNASSKPSSYTTHASAT